MTILRAIRFVNLNKNTQFHTIFHNFFKLLENLSFYGFFSVFSFCHFSALGVKEPPPVFDNMLIYNF